jgi:hypothetical protein
MNLLSARIKLLHGDKDMSDEGTRLNTLVLQRVLKDCNPNAEVVVMIGKIKLALPIEHVSVMQNGNNEEIVALNLNAEETLQILAQGAELVSQVKGAH